VDKRSCENCKINCYNGRFGERINRFTFCCKNWLRNPKLWLDLLPEVEGYYWFRIVSFMSKKWIEDICEIYTTDTEEWMVRPLHSVRTQKIEWLKNAEFQGPITPEG